MDLASPYSSKNYDFICENSINLNEDYIRYGEHNLNRSDNIIKLYNILNDIDKAIKIELSFFENSLIYCTNLDIGYEYITPVYNDKINTLFTAFDKSKIFKTKIIKEINPTYIGFLTYEKYFSEKWDSTIKKKEEKEEHENDIEYSDAYKCYKCGESKCKIAMKQIRGADEPMTTFVKCLVCGNAFKIG